MTPTIEVSKTLTGILLDVVIKIRQALLDENIIIDKITANTDVPEFHIWLQNYSLIVIVNREDNYWIESCVIKKEKLIGDIGTRSMRLLWFSLGAGDVLYKDAVPMFVHKIKEHIGPKT